MASHEPMQSKRKWGLAWSSKRWAFVIVAGLLLGLSLGGIFWLHGRLTVPPSSPLIEQPSASPPSRLTTSVPESSPVAPPPIKPTVKPPKRAPQVVQQGSSLNEILQMMGNPDRIEEDSSQNLKILYYGKLRLILQNGRLVQGQTTP